MTRVSPPQDLRAPWLRVGLILAAAVGALWFATAFTVSLVFATPRPEVAVSAWPTGVARSTLAASLIAQPAPRATVDRVTRLGLAALRRSPVDAMAARAVALSLAQRGDMAAGRRMIGYAETLSRRDLPTQLWLIEDRVAAGDVAGALRHYNRAMLTSPDLQAVMLPVLAKAVETPAVADALRPILHPGPHRSRPYWGAALVGRMLDLQASAAALRAVGEAMHLDAGVEQDRLVLAPLVERLVRLDDMADARRLYARATGDGRDLTETVVNGDFEHGHDLPPIDWTLADEADRSATIGPRDGAHGAALTLTGSQGGQAARQTVQLAPGSYLLTARTGAVETGSSPPAISVQCDDDAGTLIASASFASRKAPSGLRLPLSLPQGACARQAIVLSTASGTTQGMDDPWIDDIAIQRAP